MCAPFSTYVVTVRVGGIVRSAFTGRICRGPVWAPRVSWTVGYQASPCEICGGKSETRHFTVTLLRFSPSIIIPPLLHTHSLIHTSTTALCNVFLPVLQFSPVSVIPPLLHTHSFICYPRCIMFFSQYFSFPLSVSFHHCSIPIHPSTTHAV